MKNVSFFSYSFGCRVNQAEKEVIDQEMQNSGFSLNKESPNFVIINTCAVTNKAEREAKNLIYRLKRENPQTQIVVTGCSATYWQKHKLLKNLPIDVLINNINKEFLVKILLYPSYAGLSRLAGSKQLRGSYTRANSFASGIKRFSSQPIVNRVGCFRLDKYLNSGRALIKIQDGCQRFCSFCIVPYLRGLPKSYKINEIISQINKFTNLKEVILTAINTEAFGFDTGEKLVTLIDRTIEATKVPRISFGSIHPWSINEEFLKLYKEILPLKRLVNFFHIPIQSGSNKILSLMKRGYTKEEIMLKLIEIKKLNPFALIATDVIVGFLEETNRDFQDTVDFLEKSPISKFHIFRFSKRNNTAAFYMAKNLKEPIHQEKMKRAKILVRLNKIKYEQFLQKNVGRTSTVLFLNNNIDGFQEALLDNQLPIFIKIIKPIQLTQLYEAEILEYKKGKLFGKLISLDS